MIPVKDLGKYDKLSLEEGESDVGSNAGDMEMDVEIDMEDTTSRTENKARQTQLYLVYLVFLAEAYVALQLQSRVQFVKLTHGRTASWPRVSSHSSKCSSRVMSSAATSRRAT